MRIPRLVIATATCVASLLASSSALAATIPVTTTTDELNADGDCSLREAIQAANTDTVVDACPAGAGADRIEIPAGTYVVSLVGAGEDGNATGDWDVASDVALVGAGVDATVLDGGGIDRALDLRCLPNPDPEAGDCLGVTTIFARGFTVRNGAASSGRGGGIRNSGDAGSSATSPVTVLEDCRVTGNTAVDGGGVGNEGVLTIRRCTIENNSAQTYGGGFDAFGVSTIEDSTIRGNSSGFYGGGIADNSTLVIRNSLVVGNSAADSGAGISSLNSRVTAVNVTITGNTAGGGAGIACGSGSVNPCTMRLSHCTIAGNAASSGTGGGIRLDAGTVTLRNTIVADNTASSLPDVSGAFTSGDYNLIGDASGSSGFIAAHDEVGSNARLASVADNGGLTQTLALMPTSPAVDTGICTDLDGQTVSVDQRGVARPQIGTCDIGAFEYVAPAMPRIDVLPEPAGTNCAAGGVRIEALYDLDRDGTLTANEVVSTSYICDGPTGTSGESALIRLSVLAAGDANCPTGGTQVEGGIDDGSGGATAGDGVLSASEVDSTAYVCTGATGAQGAGGCSITAGPAGDGSWFPIVATVLGLVLRRRARRAATLVDAERA